MPTSARQTKVGLSDHRTRRSIRRRSTRRRRSLFPSHRLHEQERTKTTRHHGWVHRGLFFFNATPTSEIYTLSLHDALPISAVKLHPGAAKEGRAGSCRDRILLGLLSDRKSTRLNSSHSSISYAVFCLK